MARILSADHKGSRGKAEAVCKATGQPSLSGESLGLGGQGREESHKLEAPWKTELKDSLAGAVPSKQVPAFLRSTVRATQHLL